MLRTHKPLERFVHLVVKRHAKKMLTTLAFVLTLCIAPVLAQEGRHRPGDLPNPNIQGTFYVRGTPGIQPRTFEELCRRSSLILDGTVSESLPARRSDPTIPISLETDVVLTVN